MLIEIFANYERCQTESHKYSIDSHKPFIIIPQPLTPQTLTITPLLTT
jgi:hypothetical protein